MGLGTGVDLLSDGNDVLVRDPNTGLLTRIATDQNLAYVKTLADLTVGSGSFTKLDTAKKIIKDNTKLQSSSGYSLFQPANTNDSIVVTDSYLQPFLSATITWAAGTLVTVDVPTGHGCVEGDAFVLQVADEASDAKYAEILRAASIVSPTRLTARLPITPGAAPVGAVTFKRCIRNVVIDIDTDYNYAENSSAAQSPARMAVVAAFLADSVVRVVGRNAFKYVVLAAGCDNVKFDVSSLPNARSDTFKLYGPSNNNIVTGSSQAPEDGFSVQALEPVAFLAYMPCKGHVRNTRFKDVSARITTPGSGAFILYGDPTYSISGTVLDGGDYRAVAGSGAGSYGVAVAPGSGFTPTNNNVHDLTIKDAVIGAAAQECLAIRAAMRKLSLQNVRIEPPGDLTKRGIYFNNSCDVVEIADTYWDLSSWPSSGAHWFMYNIALINTCIFRNVKIKGHAALRFFLTTGASAGIETLILDNCDVETIDAFLRFASGLAATPTVIIRGGKYSAVLGVINYQGTGGKVLLEGPKVSGATNGLVRSEGAGVVTDIYGYATLATPAQLAVGVSSGKVNLRTPWLTYDHTSANLNKVAGNEFITSVAGGTLTANMPVIDDGTVYRCRYNSALTS